MEENMYCQNRISYRVQEGDSLYKLAKQFHTTVTELILLNSGVNPYNLQTGMRLTICPGEGYVDENESTPSEGNTNIPTKTPVGGIVIIPGTTTQPGTTTRPGTTTQPGNNMGVDLRQRMRMAWLNHITLVKFYLISFFENLSSQNACNDVVCAGGEPLFFLDYIACGKNYPEKIATIVGGVAEGCRLQ